MKRTVYVLPAMLFAMFFCFSSFAQAEIQVQPGYKAEVFASGLAGPGNISFNDKDELFVIEYAADRITKIASDGTKSLFAKSTPGASLDFGYFAPYGNFPWPISKIAFDKSNNIWIGLSGGLSTPGIDYDPYNPYGQFLDSIDRITPEGIVENMARLYMPPNCYFNDIMGLAFGPDGYLYAGDGWGMRDILKIDPLTTACTQFATGINQPIDLLFDREGNLLVVAAVSWGFSGGSKIFSIAPNGTKTTFFDNPQIKPWAIDWGPEGNLYVLAESIIYTLDPVTKSINVFALGFNGQVADIGFDSKGDLYVAEHRLGQIIKISKANHPPVADAGDNQTVEQKSCDGAGVTLNGSRSYDTDGDALTYKWSWSGGAAEGVSPTITLPPGATTVTLVVSDGQVDSEPSTIEITVQDTTPPQLSVSVNPAVLWPPNHKYVKIVPSLTITDACAATTVTQLAGAISNEPDNGLGDSDTANDILIDNGTLFLRAERSGKGDGRIYTLIYTATDAAGNRNTASTQVVVPHNR